MSTTTITSYTTLAEAEAALRRHFQSRDEARGHWGRRVRLQRAMLDLLPTGDAIYCYRHRGEEVEVLQDADGIVYA